MGITKRKFSLASLRIVSLPLPSLPISKATLRGVSSRMRDITYLIPPQKTSSPTIETGAEYDIDTSPPYSPTASEMERPSIHPQLVFDLRQACAIIVNETNPPDPDEEPDHREMLRRFEEERQAKYAAQAAQARAAEMKLHKTEAKSQKATTRWDQRVNEKAKKEYARRVEAETRRAIARDAEPERRKVIERQAELRMGSGADAIKEQPRKEQPRRYSTRRPPEDVPSSGSKTEPRVYIPTHATPAFEASTSGRKAPKTYSATMEPLEPTHTKISAKAKGKQKEAGQSYLRQSSETRSATKLELLPPVHATIVTNARAKEKEAEEPVLEQIRASLHERPKTSAAATVDYEGPSGNSSKSTTRSNTEYDTRGRPTSTAITSAVITPGDDKRTSYNRQTSFDSLDQKSSNELYTDREDSMQARAWQEHKESLRRAEEKYNKSGRAARPGSKASKRSRRWGSDADSMNDRPLSRAGSISESIRSGISYYMRPRASQDNMRSGRSSASGFSRSDSRSSSISRRSSTGWWRGSGLRRKGSWSSFRSTRPDQDEPSKLRRNGEPNLNRPLPALPGLDQYKETKTHIGQLMKAGARGRKKEKAQRSDPEHFLPQQSHQQSHHVKKESISNPILRNESMDRTLHRYRESKIMQEPARAPSSTSQTRCDSTSINPPETNRKHSSNSLPGRSHSRTSTRHSLPLKSPKIRRESDPTAGSINNKPPPPMIRGPSYQKEVEMGVYPRPMDVNKGVVRVQEVTTPNVTLVGGLSPTKGDERKGGLKGRVGRIFRAKGMEAGRREGVTAR